MLKNKHIDNTPLGFAMYFTDGKFYAPRHLIALNTLLLKLNAGLLNTRFLAVTMPPRHGKSELISVYLPFWFLMNYPNKKVIIACHGADLAAQWTRNVRNLLLEYGWLNNVKLTKQTEYHFETEAGGRCYASGIKGALLGKGADLFIIDDPVTNMIDSFSPTYNKKVWNFYKGTALSRLEPNGIMVLDMQRTNRNDLIGKLQDEQPDDWLFANFPIIAGENDFLGRSPGEALWPERYDIDDINDIKRRSGSYFFSAQYMQNPQPEDNQIIKPSWFKYYEGPPPHSKIIIQSWDTAFEDNEQNDYTVGTTWAYVNGDFYLIDMHRNKYQTPELYNIVPAQYQKHKPLKILVEYKSSGIPLVQELKRKTKLPIKPVTERGGKLFKAHAISEIIKSGQVYLPKDAKFTVDILQEFADFPSAEHDDIIDSFYYALIELNKMSDYPVLDNTKPSKSAKEHKLLKGYLK